MYGVIYLITVVLILNHQIIPKRLFFLIWFTVMLCLSFSIRWSLIESNQILHNGDFSAYVYNMKSSDKIIGYYLREPIFWFGFQFLYKIIGNAGLVFVFIDIIIFVTFYKVVSLLQIFFPKKINFSNVRYLYYGAFLCYPFIAGMHNYYRQILASLITFYAMGILKKSVIKSFFIFFISIAIHNAMIVLFPIFLLLGKNKISSSLIFLVGLTLVVGLIMPVFMSHFGYDSWYEIIKRFSSVRYVDTSNVRNIIYLYIIIIGTFSVAFLEFTFKGKANYIFVTVLAYMSSLYGFTVWFVPDHDTSRIFFLILTLLCLLFGLYIETKFRTEPVVRLIYLHVTLIPLLGLSGDGLVYNFV